MKVLAVTAEVPWPSRGGAQTRNAHLLAALAADHEVVVAALRWDERVAPAPAGITLHTVPWSLPPAHRALQEGAAGASDAFLPPAADAYSISWFASPALEDLLARLCADDPPEVAIFAETAMAQFRTALPAGTPWLLDLHDVHAAKQARRGDTDQARRVRRFETAAARSASLTVCVSAPEAQAARELLGADRVAVVPNGVDTQWFSPAAGPGEDERLVFTGSLHTAENVEGVCWFVEQVLPLVHRQLPAVTLDVVGSRPDVRVWGLAGPQVQVHADVADTRPFLARAGTVVIPLLHGGGTRLKALEAAASGRALVSTAVGVAGLDLVPDEHVLVADSPAGFAAAIVALSGAPRRREQLARAARTRVAIYDWQPVGRAWCAAVRSAVGVAR